MIKIRPEELKIMIEYIHTISGVNLDASKGYLIETRLGGLAEAEGCASFSELYYKAKSDFSKTIARKIIDGITTGETSFFRDSVPFDLLRNKILPDLIDRRTRMSRGAPISIRIWSAACSSGQEIYSTAIVLRELLGDGSRHNIKLLGTDISNQAVAAASRGIYNRIEVERGLQPGQLERYFVREKDSWKIRDEIRAMATFRHANLMEDFSLLGRFDIVLCRNVAIYFNEQDKASLFNRIAKTTLDPDGYLIIGSTESITGFCPAFESQRHLRSVFYQLKKAI